MAFKSRATESSIVTVSPFAFLALKSCSCDIGDVLLSYQEIKVDDLESLIMNSELSDEEKELLYNELFNYMTEINRILNSTKL